VFNVIENEFGIIPMEVKNALIANGYDNFYALTSLDTFDIDTVKNSTKTKMLPGHLKALNVISKLLKEKGPSYFQSKIVSTSNMISSDTGEPIIIPSSDSLRKFD
jgi:hypothetical protein